MSREIFEISSSGESTLIQWPHDVMKGWQERLNKREESEIEKRWEVWETAIKDGISMSEERTVRDTLQIVPRMKDNIVEFPGR